MVAVLGIVNVILFAVCSEQGPMEKYPGSVI